MLRMPSRSRRLQRQARNSCREHERRGQTARQRRRATGAGEQGLPPRNLGHSSANGGDFVDEPLARITPSVQLSQVGICGHCVGVATHHGADRQRARTCATSKTQSMRTKMCMRFSRLAEHMSAIVVPIAWAIEIGRQYRLLRKEIGWQPLTTIGTFENRVEACPECDRRRSSESGALSSPNVRFPLPAYHCRR
ncbi:hypothetical protein ABIC01_005672 [Bradyrhizobium sp. RT4b]